MKFSSLVSLSMIAVSFAIPLSGTGEAAEVYQETNQIKVSESENPKSSMDFQRKFQDFSTKLDSCYVNKKLDLGCFRSAKTSINDLTEDVKASEFSEAYKMKMALHLKAIEDVIFTKWQRLAEKECTQLYHFTSDCIYFNFENYAAAVEVFQRFTEDEFKRVLNYDILVKGAKDVFLDAFKSSIYELQRLSEVSTAQWSERAEFNKVEEMLASSVKIHNEIIAILKSKGVEI